jgi:hypothetical protein
MSSLDSLDVVIAVVLMWNKPGVYSFVRGPEESIRRLFELDGEEHLN